LAIGTGQRGRVPFLPLYHALLEAAKRWFDQSEYAMAVVPAQTACEVCTEQLIAAALQKKGPRVPRRAHT
jgi:hypothetical protein